MDETAPHQSATATETAGDMLRKAREAQGLALADIGTQTRVPTRHLHAIEASDYAELPSATYAVGFAKAYARAVGVDEVEIGRRVRAEVDRTGVRASDYQPYEPRDPARVPSRGLAIAGLGLAVAILVLALLWYGGTFAGPDRTETVAQVSSVRESAVPSAPASTPQPASGGDQVTLTAQGDVWLRVYDGNNDTLFIGTMKAGDRYDVPREANDPMINVGRPDLLQVTLNGSAIPAAWNRSTADQRREGKCRGDRQACRGRIGRRCSNEYRDRAGKPDDQLYCRQTRLFPC